MTYQLNLTKQRKTSNLRYFRSASGYSCYMLQEGKCYLLAPSLTISLELSSNPIDDNPNAMALLLETTLGDIVIDLDVEGSPELSKNVLKLAKARYYTSTLVYNVDPNRFCQLGDPIGDGSGGACIQGLIVSEMSGNKDILRNKQRFLKSSMGRCLTEAECREKGRVVATEMNGIPDTIGSQFLITIADGPDRALDNYSDKKAPSDQQEAERSSSGVPGGANTRQSFRSLGIVTEDDNNILDKLNGTYCDAEGRPYADVRVIRALVIDDPFEDPQNFDRLLEARGVVIADSDDDPSRQRVIESPDPEYPKEEIVERRISADQIDPDNDGDEEDEAKLREQEEKQLQRQDKSRATVLEMLGDLPSADIKAPENVLFVCKLNPVTEDEDLELIFSRFDENVKAEIIRDPDTSSSLQYAFVEFTTNEQAVEAYFKMNNTLVDDRRIKVDFSQSVANVWDRFNQKMRMPRHPPAGRNNNSRSSELNKRGDPRDGGGQESGPKQSWRGRDTPDSRHRNKDDDISKHHHHVSRTHDQDRQLREDHGRNHHGSSRDRHHTHKGGSGDHRESGRSHDDRSPRETRHRSRSRSRSRERKSRKEKKRKRSSHHRRDGRDNERYDSGRRHDGHRGNESHRSSKYDNIDGAESDGGSPRHRRQRSSSRDRRHRNSGDKDHDESYKRRYSGRSSSDDEQHSHNARHQTHDESDNKERKHSSRRKRDRDKSDRGYSSSRRHKHSRKHRHDSRS